MSHRWFTCLCITLVSVCTSALFAQERTASIKDELREQYSQQQHLDGLKGGEASQQAERVRLSGTSDVLVNNNNGSIGTARFTQSEADVLAFGNWVVISFNDAGSYTGANNQFTGWSYSSDGGVTFTDGGTLPVSTIGDAGDPVLARNETTGRIYLSTLGFTSPATIQMWRSDDNGVTWMPPVVATPGGSSEDKQWHTVDNFPGPGNGNVYVISRRFGTGPGIYVFRSTDHGDTFTPSGGVNIVSAQQGAFIAVGPDHAVYVFWYNGTTLQMRKSTDFGVTFSPAVIIFTGLIGGTNGDLGLTGIRQGTTTASAFRSSEFPHVSINPVSGHLYVTFANKGAGTDKADVFLIQSSDGGTTWSAASKINDDATTTDQWQPTIAVTPDGGQIGIFYYSREEDPVGNNLFKFQGRIGTISGSTITWQPSFPVSDVASLPEFGRDAVVNAVYMGDYNHAVATSSAFHVIWSDNRDDLAGGAPRKDPNMYYKRIPTTENFGWVRGTVTNNVGGAPIQNAEIDFVENIVQVGGFTNASGLYLAGVRVDTPATTANVTLRARRFGFLDTTLAVTLTRSDTLTRNFAMRPLDLVLTKTSITFPATPVPGLKRDSLVARNQFASPLTLSSLSTTNTDFAVSPTSVVIPAMDSTKIYVTYTPTAEGTDTGRVIVMSSSIYTPRKDVLLNGTAIGVPHFTTNVDSLTRTLEGGARDSITFRVRNNGTTSGNFSARAVMFPRTSAKAGIQIPVKVEVEQTRPADINALAPELLYYKFNESGATATQNFANPGVGTNPAPLVGQTMGGTGQFGSALIGTGTANNYVNTGWNTALGSGSWTISMWLNNLPNNTSLFYLWGDNTASSFRSFLGGAAGAGVVTLRGTGIANVDVPGVAPGPSVVHFVYDASALNIKAYRNGVLVTTVAQSALNLNGTSPFRVGAYSTSAGLPTGGLMDEFRLYNRALTAEEIATTWNSEVGSGNWFSVSPTTGTIAINDSVTMKAYFDATDESIYGNPGTYLGRLDVVATNSALADTLRIPARLFVIPPVGARISVDKDSLNFGSVQIDSSRTRSVLVRNIGGSTLTVSNITMTNTNFAASPTNFVLASLDTQRVNVTFTAPFPGAAHTGTMSFVSNDPAAPSVGLYATSLGAPAFRVRVDSLKKTLQAGTLDSIQFYMRNAGTGNGQFRALIAMFQQGGPHAGKQITVPVTIKPASSPVNEYVASDPITEGYDPSAAGQLSKGNATAGGIPQYYNFNTGGAANTFPFNITAGKRIQWIYLPGDFAQPTPAPQGRITKLYFRIATIGSGVFTDLNIKMGQTTLTELPSTDWYAGPMQTVYSRATDSLSAAAIGDWVSIQLDVPFAYDPTLSLVIDVNQCARVGSGLSTYHTGISGVRRLASLVGGSCPLPFANTSNLMAHCGIDVSGGTWLSLAPLEGTVAIGDSILMTAYFDATDTSVSNHPGNYFGEISVLATNSQLADTLKVPVRMLVTPSTGVVGTGSGIPEEFTLEQNYPNPFNPTTTIKFGLPRESAVKLTIFNILGQEVVTLSDEIRGAGYFLATWDGLNRTGGKVSSGVYFYRMEATSTDKEQTFTSLKKMLLLK